MSNHSISAIKNAEFEYEHVSKPLANLLGFKKPTDAIGLTDRDLNCKAAENCAWFQAHDRLVIDNAAHLSLLGFNQYADGWHLLLSQKSQPHIPDAQKKIIINTFDITNISMLNMGVLLNDIFSKKILNREPFSFQIDSKYADINLSQQESLCLFYFFHGYAVKLIARELSISPSTVETYLNRIKYKLGCSNRSQIIEKMHHLNLMKSIILQ